VEKRSGARLPNTAHAVGRTYYSYETVAGDVFSAVRPGMGAEGERAVREWLVKLMEIHVEGMVQPEQMGLPEYEEVLTGDYIFENEWQSFCTSKDRSLELANVEVTI
jgi:hypothetical protein